MESRVNGLITYLECDEETDQCKVRLWYRNLVVPITFVANRHSIPHLKVGSWISVCADEIREQNIVSADLISDIVPTKLVTTSRSNEPVISLTVCLAFPPAEWACINGYSNLAFCEHIGMVGNFAAKNLSEVNDNIEPNVCYEAEIASFHHRIVSNKYRTIWAIKRQKLTRIENDQFLKQCPWNEEFADSDWEDALINDRSEHQTENTESFITERNECEQEPIPMMISISDEQLSENEKLIQGVNIGVAVKYQRNSITVYGKNHGLVSIESAEPLSLQLGDWINYECIEDNESNANAVHHLVYDWKRIDDRPCVAKVIDEKFVNLHTSIRLLDDIGYESDSLRVPRGYRVAEGDLCDRILVKNTRRVRNSLAEQHHIDVVLEFNDETFPGFYWIVTAVYKDGISFKIDDNDIEDISETTRNDNKNDQAQSSRSTGEIEKRKPIEDEIVAETKQPQRIPQLKAEGDQRERDDVCSRLLEKREKEANEDELTLEMSRFAIDNDVKRVAMAIFVRKMKNYGIIWNLKFKSIIVPIEHCSHLNVGIWVKARVSAITNGTKYHYITRKPITQIDEKLPLRCQDGIVQIRVHLERGGEQINSDKHTYLGKISEVGRVMIDYNRLESSDQEKRLLAWATFVENSDSYDWMVVYQGCLIEIDDHNNEIGVLSARRYDIDHMVPDLENPISEAEERSSDIDESALNISTEQQIESEQCKEMSTPHSSSSLISNVSVQDQAKQPPMRALQKIFDNCEVRRFVWSNGCGSELDTVLNWMKVSSNRDDIQNSIRTNASICFIQALSIFLSLLPLISLIAFAISIVAKSIIYLSYV